MDNWGYRYLPGVLFVFLIGNLLHDPKSKLAKQVIALTLAFLILLITTLPTTILTVNLGRSVIIGIIIGTVVLIRLTRIPSQEQNNLAENLSYGVFLNHNLIVGMLHIFFFLQRSRANPPL
jgi:4-hydroxybenzoate polyprenyltransferase